MISRYSLLVLAAIAAGPSYSQKKTAPAKQTVSYDEKNFTMPSNGAALVLTGAGDPLRSPEFLEKQICTTWEQPAEA